MRRATSWLPVILPLVVGCHPSAKDGPDKGTVRIADGGGEDGVSLRVPGLDASLSLPGMDLSRHADLDGIRLAPGTHVGAMDIADRRGPGDGHLRLAFTDPRPPAALVDYYRAAAARAGFGAVSATADGVEATKGDRRFALVVEPDGAGSRGTITLGGA